MLIDEHNARPETLNAFARAWQLFAHDLALDAAPSDKLTAARREAEMFGVMAEWSAKRRAEHRAKVRVLPTDEVA